MAKKISQLTQATEVKSDDVTVIVQDGETKKLPLNMMVTKQDIENKKVAGLAKLDEIEATYENDTYTPTITVKNKSSVKVGEGDGVDYSANVMDGHVKSAILTGQTLLVDELGNECEIPNSPKITIGAWINTNTGVETASVTSFNTGFLKCPTVTFVVKGNNKYKRIVFYDENKTFISGIDTKVSNNSDVTIASTKIPSNAFYLRISASNNTEGVSYTPDTKLLIEDVSGNNLYSTQLVSVKMPVLTTVGKNLFDGELEIGTVNADTGELFDYKTRSRTVNFLNIKPNTSYSLKLFNDGYQFNRVFFYDSQKNYISNIYIDKSEKIVTSPENARYIKLVFKKQDGSNMENNDLINISNIVQFEQGTVVTPYEPYKSNILTVNEEVTLRGIGDVQDELNLLTGEVTERISEIVLDGSQTYTIASGTTYNDVIRFRYGSTNLNCTTNNLFICDVLPCSNTSLSNNELVYVSDNMIYFNILKTKATTVDELKIYLQSNPITVQYQLTKEPIKTVDLMPSGTHPSTTPYCWKNGHIQLSSSGLLPNLEYSVVTSRAGQINQNATMIVKNDKRIFDLEILLAGGLVNTTYQALTLQNQVETGLSKVSLNSETEPDYLLYHMIMKLIEEKAYKLDDLTEKVSVFYLYEKLSDEQFETIYSALYPFVEDEIVEELVVEELPEVVEDEVIM